MGCGALHDIELCRGRDFSQIFQVDDGNGFIDLSGYTFKASIKNEISKHNFNFEPIAGSSTAIKMFLTDTETSAITAGTYKWDLLATNNNNIDSNWLYGTVTVLNTVTEKIEQQSRTESYDGFRIY